MLPQLNQHKRRIIHSYEATLNILHSYIINLTSIYHIYIYINEITYYHNKESHTHSYQCYIFCQSLSSEGLARLPRWHAEMAVLKVTTSVTMIMISCTAKKDMFVNCHVFLFACSSCLKSSFYVDHVFFPELRHITTNILRLKRNLLLWRCSVHRKLSQELCTSYGKHTVQKVCFPPFCPLRMYIVLLHQNTSVRQCVSTTSF